MAVISGQKRELVAEINSGGVVTELEYTQRINQLISRIETLESGGSTTSSGGFTVDGGDPNTVHTNNIKIDFGGVQ